MAVCGSQVPFGRGLPSVCLCFRESYPIRDGLCSVSWGESRAVVVVDGSFCHVHVDGCPVAVSGSMYWDHDVVVLVWVYVPSFDSLVSCFWCGGCCCVRRAHGREEVCVENRGPRQSFC